MKQFVKALDKSGFFLYYESISRSSSEKIKAGIFDGLKIRLFIKDENFIKHMIIVESAAWSGFGGVVRGFLSGSKNENYKKLVDNMLTSFHSQGVRMTVKAYF